MMANVAEAGAGVRATLEPEVQPRSGGLGWVQAGIIVFSFAAPSAIMEVPYAIGMAGFLGGSLICLVLTCASIAGALMMLEVKLTFPHCKTFGELGGEVLGKPGAIWGNAIQLGNFCLFLPCALKFTALALQGIGDGFPGFHGCTDYYILVIALACLLTTQARTLTNTQKFTCISIVCVFGMAATLICAEIDYDRAHKVPAQLIGNPEPNVLARLVRAAGGFTIGAWSFVPGFITVELADSMGDPRVFRKSLLMAGGLNMAMFLGVGVPVVAKWGYKVGEVVTLTKGLSAWSAGAVTNTTFNCFLLAGSYVSYMLSSIPLGRYCQRKFAPDFADTWSLPDVVRYLLYTLPTFFLALLLAIFVPSVNTMLDFVTAFTTPWVTQIYPAVLYWRLYSRDEHLGLLERRQDLEDCRHRGLSRIQAFGVVTVFLLGCLSFAICLTKACGYVAIEELRPPFQIGCDGWTILSPGKSSSASFWTEALLE